MAFALQYDVPGRAVPDALRTLVVQQAEALETLLQHTLGAIAVIRSRPNTSPHETTERVQLLTQELTTHLSSLAKESIQVEQKLDTLRQRTTQQKNSTLLYTLEHVNEVLHANFAVARQHLATIANADTPS